MSEPTPKYMCDSEIKVFLRWVKDNHKDFGLSYTHDPLKGFILVESGEGRDIKSLTYQNGLAWTHLGWISCNIFDWMKFIEGEI